MCGVRSALHFSAALGNVKITQMLCQAGADVDLGDKDGATQFATYSESNVTLLASVCCPQDSVAMTLLSP